MLASAARRCVAESSPKLSLNALVGGASLPANRIGADGRDIAVGDQVDVPGEMYGVVKLIGIVNGEKGTFAGVQLSQEYASGWKNDSEVDG
jgi:hypothetical protein